MTFLAGLLTGLLFSLGAVGLGYLIGLRFADLEPQSDEPRARARPQLPRIFPKAFSKQREKRKPKAHDDVSAWKREQEEREDKSGPGFVGGP